MEGSNDETNPIGREHISKKSKIFKIKMKTIYIIFMFVVLTSYSQAVYDKISQGAYQVGFRSISAYDGSRPAVKEQLEKSQGRVLQINVWYPASENDAPKINFNEYVHLIGKERNPEKDDRQLALSSFYDWTFQNQIQSNEMLEFKKNGLEMNASFDLKPSNEPFPVVLLVHGGAADFAFLGEFLASHGYIVLNVPYKGYRQAELDVDVVGMQTEVKDYEFALARVEDLMALDSKNLSVIGASFGGQAALLFSFFNKVKCVLSYDGGIGSVFGANLLQSDPSYSLGKINVPLLHFYNPKDVYTNLTFIRQYKNSDRTLISMKNMEHAHFWSWGILDRYLPHVVNTIRPGNSYEALLQETLNFLSKHVRGKEKTCDWCGDFQNSREYLNAG